jgi:hypothetical protein
MRARLAVAERSIRYEVHSRSGTTRPYLAFARVSRHRSEAARAGTALVIDGFPRSANTFATIAFQVAQPSPVRLGHHLHAPAHLVTAVNEGIPALALIRDPVDTVVSEAMREAPVSLRTVIAAYRRFYETLMPVVERLTIGRFDVVTSDLGSLIDEIDRRHGVGFTRFEHTPDNVDLVFRLIEERERRPEAKNVDRLLAGELTVAEVLEAIRRLDAMGAPTVRAEHAISRPSEERAATRAEILRELERPALREPLRRARELFERITARA